MYLLRPWRQPHRRHKSELRWTKHERPIRNIKAPRKPRSREWKGTNWIMKNLGEGSPRGPRRLPLRRGANQSNSYDPIALDGSNSQSNRTTTRIARHHNKGSGYSLLHLEYHSIWISNLNLIGLFSMERDKRNLEVQIIDWDSRLKKWHFNCNRLYYWRSMPAHTCVGS